MAYMSLDDHLWTRHSRPADELDHVALRVRSYPGVLKLLGRFVDHEQTELLLHLRSSTDEEVVASLIYGGFEDNSHRPATEYHFPLRELWVSVHIHLVRDTTDQNALTPLNLKDGPGPTLHHRTGRRTGPLGDGASRRFRRVAS
jgi:hypothetical protein